MMMLGLVLCFTSVAHAQRRTASPEQAAKDEAAREHYKQGILHYDLGEIDQAVADFKQAYELSAAPGLLFNIAQAYRYKKDYEQALHFYRTYLRLQPKAGNRQEVEERVAELEKLIEESQKAQSGRPHGVIPPGENAAGQEQPGNAATSQPPQQPQATGQEAKPAPTPEPAPATVTLTPAPVTDRSVRAFVKTPAGQAAIAVGVIGAAALITAAALGGTVLSARDEYARGCDAGHCDNALYDSAHDRALATDVLIGIGAAAVVTSAILLAVRPGLRAQASRTPVRLNAANLTVSF
jgi:tetratricopeptide (TPR) repeat protein